jgi:hypothetical protein
MKPQAFVRIIALQEFDIVFKYTKGRDHVAPDYLSRPN